MRDDGLADDFLRGQRVEVCDCIVRRISCRAQAVMPDERLRFTADATLGGADRMLLDDKALLVLFPLYDARRAIAEIWNPCSDPTGRVVRGCGRRRRRSAGAPVLLSPTSQSHVNIGAADH